MEIVSHLFPMIIGVMVSPMPIAAVIVLCIVGKARTTALAFSVGWLLSILLQAGLAASAAAAASEGDGQPSTFSIVVQVVIGLLMLGLAIQNWRTRPHSDAEVKEPGWIQTIAHMGGLATLGIGFVIGITNAKNWSSTASAAVVIGDSLASDSEKIALVIVFAVLASLSVALVPIATMLGGDGVDHALHRMQKWLYRWNNVILTVVFGLVGWSMLSKAISLATSY